MTIIQAGQAVLERTGTDDTQEVIYRIQSDESDVEEQVVDVVAWINGSMPQELLGEDISSVNYKEVGSGWWDITASYSSARQEQQDKESEPEIDEDPDWRFSIATESRNIKLSRSLVSATPSTGFTNYLSKPYPINYDGQEVQGIDIAIPVASWDETYYFNPTVITPTYKMNCLKLVGSVNDATFRTCAARQVLLQSVEGNKKAADPWIVTFSFLFKDNVTATYRMSDGQDRQVTTIGHQLIDVRYGKGKIGNVTCGIPKVILVHDVYPLGDFSLLGIGS